MPSGHSQHKGGGLRPPPQRGGGLRPRPFVVSFVLALSKAHVLALNTAHVLRLNKADVLALNKAHVLHLNTKICPVLTANTKETTTGGAAEGCLLCIGSEQSTCSSFQHSTCLASQQGRCLGSQQGRITPLNTRHNLFSEQSLLIFARSCFLEK